MFDTAQLHVRRRRGAAVFAGLAAVTALGAAACSETTTQLTDVWSTRQAVAPMRSVLVIGARTDDTARRALEVRFTDELATHGVRATPSYELFPNGFPTTEVAKDTVRQVGFDGLLVATSKGTTERTTVVPAGYDYDFWYGYYYPGWGGWYPGYVYTDQYVKFETTLWDAREGGKLVWSAVTMTKNPSSGTDFLDSLSKAVFPALTKGGFIPPKGTPERLSLADQPPGGAPLLLPGPPLPLPLPPPLLLGDGELVDRSKVALKQASMSVQAFCVHAPPSEMVESL